MSCHSCYSRCIGFSPAHLRVTKLRWSTRKFLRRTGSLKSMKKNSCFIWTVNLKGPFNFQAKTVLEIVLFLSLPLLTRTSLSQSCDIQTGQKLLRIGNSKIPQEQQFSVYTHLAPTSNLTRSAILLLPRMITVICWGCRASLFAFLVSFDGMLFLFSSV